ncbi:15522_t:CDS:1, partial [Cetraspora pellucida]
MSETISLYKTEENGSISCIQEECNYKFRNPKNKHKCIMDHYYKKHKEVYKQLKIYTKLYSKSLNQTHIENTKTSFEYESKSIKNEKYLQNKSFCFHYLVDGNYFNIEFLKVNNGYEMKFFLKDELLKIIDNLLDDFSYNFISFNNNEKFQIINNEFLFLNKDVKIAKIFYKHNLVFETHNL